jgi:predicted enzyme related to lactoylglutathione lyase
MAKIKANGGELLTDKMAVPMVGYLVYFKDPDGNIFGAMESDPSAK